MKPQLSGLEGAGGIVGTGISAAFLFLIAAINAFVLAEVVGALAGRHRGIEVAGLFRGSL